MTVSIYLAHLNPVTNAHVEIIEDLKNESDVKVMPVIFQKNGNEVNSKSFPFSFEIRKEMLESVLAPLLTFHHTIPLLRHLIALFRP